MKKLVCLLLSIILVSTMIGASAATIKYGTSGTAVRELQTRLSTLGYYKYAIDGVYKYNTWEAVWKYQRDQKLPATGLADDTTRAYLGLVKSSSLPTGKSLKYGDKNQSVLALQKALASAKYYNGPLDGVYGDGTWMAVWTFQRDNGLSATGLADATTVAMLGTGSTAGSSLKYGSSGPLVSAVQTKLKALGYYSGSIDGKYGDLLWTAVWQYQYNNSLAADGIAGPKTLAKLGISSSGSSATIPSTTALKMGAKGSAVSALQHALIALGYLSGSANSTYDYATWEAVWWLQKNNGLYADGVAGPKTLDLINSGTALKK